MRLPVSRFGALFVIGAVVTPFGDHGHIASGTTEYIARGGPFIWDTSIWFPLLVASLVALLTAVIGDRASAICGLAAGVGGTVIEIALIAAKQFRYADDIGVFMTVAPWTPPLYFAFGVVAARLGEVAACGAASGHEHER